MKIIYNINHNTRKELCWSKLKKRWINIITESFKIEELQYFRYPTKIPEHGYVEEEDVHVCCPSWPNCDLDLHGCLYSELYMGD